MKSSSFVAPDASDHITAAQSGVRSAQLVTVEFQKQLEQNQSDTLVAVDERMIANQRDRMQGCEQGNVSRTSRCAGGQVRIRAS